MGPRGLDLLALPLIQLFDLGVVMGLAMLGVSVGLNLDLKQPRIESVGPAVLIVAAGVTTGAMRATAAGGFLMVTAAVVVVATVVALSAWLLVGQTSSEGEQHVFIAAALLLIGGAMTYLSLSAVFGGLLAGLAWNLAGNIAKARIVRDLEYFQHPLAVLVLLTAGAAAPLSRDVLAFAAVFGVLRALSAMAGALSAGIVLIALALDMFRVDGRPEWAATLLGAIAVGTILAEAFFLVVPVRAAAR